MAPRNPKKPQDDTEQAQDEGELARGASDAAADEQLLLVPECVPHGLDRLVRRRVLDEGAVAGNPHLRRINPLIGEQLGAASAAVDASWGARGYSTGQSSLSEGLNWSEPPAPARRLR